MGESFGKTKTIIIDPNVSDKSRIPSTIAHEISHQQLGHSADIPPVKDELKTRFRQVLESSFEGVEGLDTLKGFEDITSLIPDLNEIEVRLYLRKKGYAEQESDSFRNYLIRELKEFSDYKVRRTILDVALQAIANMQKKKVLSRSEAKFYRKGVYSLIRSFGLRRWYV